MARDGSDAGHRRPHVDIAPAIRQSGVTLLHVEELARNVQWASREPEVADEIRALLVGSRAAALARVERDVLDALARVDIFNPTSM